MPQLPLQSNERLVIEQNERRKLTERYCLHVKKMLEVPPTPNKKKLMTAAFALLRSYAAS